MVKTSSILFSFVSGYDKKCCTKEHMLNFLLRYLIQRFQELRHPESNLSVCLFQTINLLLLLMMPSYRGPHITHTRQLQ